MLTEEATLHQEELLSPYDGAAAAADEAEILTEERCWPFPTTAICCSASSDPGIKRDGPFSPGGPGADIHNIQKRLRIEKYRKSSPTESASGKVRAARQSLRE